MNIFRNKLLRWFSEHGRRYSWRKTTNPFRILIAEMMLQRTKADQVEPVYQSFFSAFKSPQDVASASAKRLNHILFPLGLRWRIKRFKEVSRVLVDVFNSKVPDTREDILRLPGVGEYVAGMVLSTAFRKNEWMVDSNVVRIFKRYSGIKTSKEGRRDRHVIEMAKIYISETDPRKANLAILDFAALICIPRQPICQRCPLSESCYYFKRKLI